MTPLNKTKARCEMIYEGYFIEKEHFEKLHRISDRLHGGSDAMRDEGHKLELVLRDAHNIRLYGCGEEWETVEGEVK